jgi:hypothetical protein
MSTPFQQTDISDYPELEVVRAAELPGEEPPHIEADICHNPDCPNDGKIETHAFKGTGYCSVNCRKTAGIDHVDYAKSEMMLVTRGEASQIRKGRQSS